MNEERLKLGFLPRGFFLRLVGLAVRYSQRTMTQKKYLQHELKRNFGRLQFGHDTEYVLEHLSELHCIKVSTGLRVLDGDGDPGLPLRVLDRVLMLVDQTARQYSQNSMMLADNLHRHVLIPSDDPARVYVDFTALRAADDSDCFPALRPSDKRNQTAHELKTAQCIAPWFPQIVNRAGNRLFLSCNWGDAYDGGLLREVYDSFDGEIGSLVPLQMYGQTPTDAVLEARLTALSASTVAAVAVSVSAIESLAWRTDKSNVNHVLLEWWAMLELQKLHKAHGGTVSALACISTIVCHEGESLGLANGSKSIVTAIEGLVVPQRVLDATFGRLQLFMNHKSRAPTRTIQILSASQVLMDLIGIDVGTDALLTDAAAVAKYLATLVRRHCYSDGQGEEGDGHNGAHATASIDHGREECPAAARENLSSSDVGLSRDAEANARYHQAIIVLQGTVNVVSKLVERVLQRKVSEIVDRIDALSDDVDHVCKPQKDKHACDEGAGGRLGRVEEYKTAFIGLHILKAGKHLQWKNSKWGNLQQWGDLQKWVPDTGAIEMAKLYCPRIHAAADMVSFEDVDGTVVLNLLRVCSLFPAYNDVDKKPGLGWFAGQARNNLKHSPG